MRTQAVNGYDDMTGSPGEAMIVALSACLKIATDPLSMPRCLER